MLPKYWLFLFMLLLLVPLSVSASDDHPPPSASGGLVGGPGMANAALPPPTINATPEAVPTHLVDTVPAINGEVPHGNTPPPISPDQVYITNDPMLVGLDAPGETSGQPSRAALVVLPADVFANFRSSVQAGGFGARTQGGAVPPGGQSFVWPQSSMTAPIALGDFSTLAQAGQTAQTAVAAAIAQPSAANDAAASAATQQAQQTYDQFWNDYDASVSAAGQQYYTAVMASSEVFQQSYQEAVTQASAPIDYARAYADQFARYCAIYPWDCYSYRYDPRTFSYTYAGDASAAPIKVAQLSAPAAAISYATQPLASDPDAYTALLLFANDQLGAAINPLYAGSLTADVKPIMQQLPPPLQAYFLKAAGSSGSTQWGLLNGGAAGVAVGDCANHPANCASDLTIQLSSSAAGVIGLLTNEAVPDTPQAALKLISTVYPKLSGPPFTQITDLGLAFTTTTRSLGYDVATHQPVAVPKIVYAGVVGVNDQAFVYALVGVGEGAVSSLSK